MLPIHSIFVLGKGLFKLHSLCFQAKTPCEELIFLFLPHEASWKFYMKFTSLPRTQPAILLLWFLRLYEVHRTPACFARRTGRPQPLLSSGSSWSRWNLDVGKSSLLYSCLTHRFCLASEPILSTYMCAFVRPWKDRDFQPHRPLLLSVLLLFHGDLQAVNV